MTDMIMQRIKKFDTKQMMKKIQEYFYKRKMYNLTVRELEKLSNRELADMGIYRGEIRRIAKEHSDRSEINDNLQGWV